MLVLSQIAIQDPVYFVHAIMLLQSQLKKRWKGMGGNRFFGEIEKNNEPATLQLLH